MILGSSFDTVDEQRRFAEKYHFPFSLLADTDRSIGLAYGACESAKDAFAARIAYLIGKDGKILEAHPKVNASTYPEEQLASLKKRT